MSTEEATKQKYRVHLTSHQSASVTVEAEDPEAAIDEALTEGIQGICALCSGYGQDWARDVDDDEWVPESVSDATGQEVWTGPSAVGEAIIRELSYIRSAADESPDVALKLIDTRLLKLREGLS